MRSWRVVRSKLQTKHDAVLFLVLFRDSSLCLTCSSIFPSFELKRLRLSSGDKSSNLEGGCLSKHKRECSGCRCDLKKCNKNWWLFGLENVRGNRKWQQRDLFHFCLTVWLYHTLTGAGSNYAVSVYCMSEPNTSCVISLLCIRPRSKTNELNST
jgi:hypothetical protein